MSVATESAISHLACAVGIPNVVVVGGGHFGRFFPYSRLTAMVALPLSCYFCDWRCTYGNAHCVQDLDPDVLRTAVEHHLTGIGDRPRVFLQGSYTGSKAQWMDLGPMLNSEEAEIVR